MTAFWIASAVAAGFLAGVAVTLQISVGHAIYPSEGRSFEALSRRADERMYQDKSERKRRGVSGPVGANLER